MVLGNFMLGGGFINSRLATRIRQKDGLELREFPPAVAATKEKDGAFRVNAIAAPQNVAKVEVAFKEEMERALKDGFTAEEVAAAKSGWLQTQKVKPVGRRASRGHVGHPRFRRAHAGVGRGSREEGSGIDRRNRSRTRCAGTWTFRRCQS